MNEDDVRLIRQIVKEQLYEILETEFYDPLFSMLDAFESGITSFRHALGQKKGVEAVKEETFTCLKFEPQQGAKIGQFEVAYKANNIEDNWTQAYNILRQNNATINNRYHGEGYQFSYWLYGEGKIYRQKLKPKAT